MRLDEVLQAYGQLPQDLQAEVAGHALEATKHLVFVPSPGPQTEGYFSEADVLLFGGSPGGGKTVLEIGLGLNAHYRTLMVRKSFTDLEGIIDTAKKLVGSEEGFVGGSRPKYRKPDGGVIHFAGLAADGGIGGHQGVDHDLICVDECAQIPEKQVRLLMGWLRTDRLGQRCRVVLGSNPPLDSVGDWMIDFFGPWLNPNHPNPAKPGELRWFLPIEDGHDRECAKGDFTHIGGERVYAQSRTYIPSSFTDNPFYDPEAYAKTLAALPKEVRERLVTGNFMLARTDPAFQLIPTAWVTAAQQRWTPQQPQGVPMCAIGIDPAQGGPDKTVLAPRYDGWYAPLIAVPGEETPLGSDIAALVVKHRRNDADIVLDMGGGYGNAAYERLVDNGIRPVAYKGAEGAMGRTRDGKFRFRNKRTMAYWKFREALDPDQDGGSPIALPNDPELRADLTAATYEIGPHGIEAESKEDVTKKLGRSPDKGDAVVMAWTRGSHQAGNSAHRSDRRRITSLQVNLGPRRK